MPIKYRGNLSSFFAEKQLIFYSPLGAQNIILLLESRIRLYIWKRAIDYERGKSNFFINKKKQMFQGLY